MVVPNIEMLSKWQPARLKNRVPIKAAVLISITYLHMLLYCFNTSTSIFLK